MRPIDADELLERWKCGDCYGTYGECEIHDLELAPTLDVIPTSFIENWIKKIEYLIKTDDVTLLTDHKLHHRALTWILQKWREKCIYPKDSKKYKLN